MTVNFDPANDLANIVDGTESVTLLRRGSTPGSGTVIPHALRRAADTDEAGIRNRYNTRKRPPSDGRYTAGDCHWHLPTEELTDAPRLGDVILDGDGQRWTVLEVKAATLQSRWQCKSCNLAIAHGLDDTISILEATYAKGDAGAAEPSWRTWKTGIRARIQKAETKIVVENETRRTTQRVQIFVEEDLELDHTHAVQGPDGTIYRIRATLGAERIGELQTIDAEVTS